ncbi:LLM class flavin-dependent oxidoreductase [Falsiroseomonas oryzae]|uniref:LLM class flavin-dependent oxidoreductase n=1 Tax=Falsiroseomonas oryzae TaxID=2766473 RepID=UPI0022EB3F09|nr:LLM class flavin-dependent oxidoreductase [Roseomonas sp. MO-31]
MPDAWPSAVGVSLEGREPLASVPALASAAEAGGAGTLWVASHLFLRDPVTMAQVALAATTQLRVALMAMSPYAMHPVHIAMAAAALDELHPGRVVLCLGTGAPADRDAAGIAAPHPLATLREAVLVCRGLLAGDKVRLDGKAFRLGGHRALAAGPARVPVVIAASRPGMLRLAGEVADGVLLSGGSSRPYVRRCLDIVGEAAAGRPVARLGLVYAAHVPPGADRHAALAPVRRRLAFVLRGAHHAENLAAAGTVLDQARLYALTQAGDWDAAMALLDDDAVAHHAAAGSPEELAAALAEYRAAGLDEVVLANLADAEAIAATLRAAGGAT